MCLAVPHVITELLDPRTARARAGRAEVTIRLDLLEDLREGETVLVHGGFAIERVAPEAEAELASLWEEVRRLAGS